MNRVDCFTNRWVCVLPHWLKHIGSSKFYFIAEKNTYKECTTVGSIALFCQKNKQTIQPILYSVVSHDTDLKIEVCIYPPFGSEVLDDWSWGQYHMRTSAHDYYSRICDARSYRETPQFTTIGWLTNNRINCM